LEGNGILYIRRTNTKTSYYPLWCGNSSHGQKGVCGMILPNEDMPFTQDGLIPDIIINPHAIPSRMTISHLIECVSAKLACMEGTYIDATSFEMHNFDLIHNKLTKYNLHKYGDEILYNGNTGEQIKSEIFFGPTYYYRMKHMVEDKINYRTTGPVQALTRQPTHGRAQEGGLKIGGMEMDALISHGISSFIKESMIERSDKYLTSVNKETGTLSFVNEKYKTIMSELKNELNVSDSDHGLIEIPYAMKLLIQELAGLSLSLKLNVDKETIFNEEEEQEKYSAFQDNYWDVNNEETDILDENDNQLEEEKDEVTDLNEYLE
jgi:DNA-directed RNA polymerase II subunit RPB2